MIFLFSVIYFSNVKSGLSNGCKTRRESKYGGENLQGELNYQISLQYIPCKLTKIEKTVYSDYKVLSKFDNLCQFLVYVCWGWVGFVNFFFRLEFESSWLFRAVRVSFGVAEGFGRSINWLELDLLDLSPVRYNRTMNHNRVFLLEIVEKILGRC